MSDRYFASIRIGGDLPRKQVAPMCALLGLDGTSEEELVAHVREGHLVHEDEQAAWGEFYELEKACREMGLPYERHSEGYWNYPPQYASWQPGMDGPETVTTDSDGNLLASMDTLCEVRDHLRNGRGTEALALLDETITELPELPPFRLV